MAALLNFFGLQSPYRRDRLKYSRVATGREVVFGRNSPEDIQDEHLFLDKTSSPGRNKTTAFQRYIFYACLLLFGILSFVLIETYLSIWATASDHVLRSPCGNSSQEAKERGCHFDPTSFCWLPDTCYDAELAMEFQQHTDWAWYLHPNGTHKVSKEEVMTGDFTGLFVNQEYHLYHCTTMWRKLHRAILGRGKASIDSYIGSIGHTEHCGHMLFQQQAVAFDALNTIILVKFPDCGIE